MLECNPTADVLAPTLNVHEFGIETGARFSFRTPLLRSFLEGLTTVDYLPLSMGALAFELREEVEPLQFSEVWAEKALVQKAWLDIAGIESLVEASSKRAGFDSDFLSGDIVENVEEAQHVLDALQFWFEAPSLTGPYVQGCDVGLDEKNRFQVTPGNVCAALGLRVLDSFCQRFSEFDSVEAICCWGLAWNLLAQGKFLNATLIGSHVQRIAACGADRELPSMNRVVHVYSSHPKGTTGMRTSGYAARPMTEGCQIKNPMMDYCMRALRRSHPDDIN